LAESEGCPPESGAECRVSWAEVLTRRGSTESKREGEVETERERDEEREESESQRITLAERQGGRMVEKGGRQRERERHTGEPSTQARSTWPTHIAPTRFLSLADNCTISLHSLVLSSLPLTAHCVLFSPVSPNVPRSLFLIFLPRPTR